MSQLATRPARADFGLTLLAIAVILAFLASRSCGMEEAHAEANALGLPPGATQTNYSANSVTNAAALIVPGSVGSALRVVCWTADNADDIRVGNLESAPVSDAGFILPENQPWEWIRPSMGVTMRVDATAGPFLVYCMSERYTSG